MLSFGEGKRAPKPVGWMMCFLLIAPGLFQARVVLYVITFYFSILFNKLNLIFVYYSSVTSSCVLSEITSVAVNGSLYKCCLYGACFHFDFPLTPQSWMSNCYHNLLNVRIGGNLLHLFFMCLEIHTSQWCFYHRTFFENTGLNSFSWSAPVPWWHSQLGWFARGFELCDWLALLLLAPRIDHTPHVCQSLNFFFANIL